MRRQASPGVQTASVALTISRLCCEVLVPTADEADKSFQEGLEGATQSSRLSALASMGNQNATPSTIVSLQLPIAGKLEFLAKRACLS